MEILTNEMETPNTCVLKFGASWCGPCRTLNPVMDEIAAENGDVQTYSIDCDTEKELTAKFQVRNIPVTVFIKDGNVIDRLIGVNPKEVIQSKYDLLK
jgi:thioredoxin 1